MSAERNEQTPLRIKSRSVVLARVNTSGTTLTSASAVARIRNPSRRLSLIVTIAFEADGNQRPASYGTSVWQMRAMRPNRVTGRTAPLHLVVADALLLEFELQLLIEIVHLVPGVLLVLREIEAAAVRDPFKLAKIRRGERVLVLDVHGHL